ncbi:hypothetical protein LCGC14_1343680 [marine sediment metagenome]|uniref:HNH domain-containing protein n=1 Tax=marine sediment metagenome TaxID=412755 RepID=A0A0F9KZC2_9ZZZZ
MVKVCPNCNKEHQKRERFCCSKCQVSYWHKAHPESTQRARQKFYTKVSKDFNTFKEGIGCTFCDYAKCGASLDYHHVGNKDFTVNAEEWHCGNERVKEELAKCILLCKNCHSELHYKERRGK